MNILVLAWDIPATTRMAGSPRLFNLCRYLSQRHRLTLVSFNIEADRYHAFLDDPASKGVFDEIVLLDDKSAPGWRHRLAHRWHREPYFVTRYLAPDFHARQCQRIQEVFGRNQADVVFADGLSMAQYVMDGDLQCPAVIDLHDSLSLLSLRAAQTERNWRGKIAEYRQYRRIRRWEKSLSRRFSSIITNSEVDNAFLKTLDAAGNMVAIGNGVDSEFFTPAGGAVEPNRLVFTGVVDYPPNEDAILYFCDAILPLIQARCPNVQFWVVGKYPTESVKAQEKRPGVVVTGGVPDVRPYIDAAAVFVCPLRYGTGVKNKILAALSMQKAVVATRISLEGLDLQEDEHVLAADQPEAFADQVIRLIEDQDLAVRLGRTGRERVSSTYSWESSAGTLEALLDKAVEEYRRAA